MRFRTWRGPAARLVAALLLVLVTGCGSGTDVELKKEPLIPLSPPKKVEELPKEQRPRAGSSGSMNYDPSGVQPK